MKGVILAAGKGSRLYPITHHMAKPLLPLANRPTMHYAFDRLKEMGISEVCVVVGENEQEMKSALGDGSQFGLKLAFARQTEPKGLAHAVSFTEEFVDGDSFCLYLGDAIYSQSMVRFAKRFQESGCANLNIVKVVPDPSRFGIAFTEGERITKLVEKPVNPPTNLAMAGLYFFGPKIWKAIDGLEPSGRGEYEITDAIQRLVDMGETVLAGVYEGEWFDTGTLDSFLETSAFLAGGNMIDPTAQVVGKVGESVVIGAGAQVGCESIEDSVVMPGAKVHVQGPIRHAILAGEVTSASGLADVIRYSDEA
ncbi:MAG: NTP transferase domain-containing protein [Armatimonadetes bacterium]|nr:NTP transferase domain-containing protein [Armatimonadota bacterium]